MHPFFIFAILLHVSLLAVIGFFVLLAADRATGRLQNVGRVIGIWVFVLAAVALVGGIAAVASGRLPGRGWMAERHGPGGMMAGYPQGQMVSGYPQSQMMPGYPQSQMMPAYPRRGPIMASPPSAAGPEGAQANLRPPAGQ